jgi:hypothetical protein
MQSTVLIQAGKRLPGYSPSLPAQLLILPDTVPGGLSPAEQGPGYDLISQNWKALFVVCGTA